MEMNMENLRQERESFMRLEEIKKCRELASKTKFLFWISIAGLVLDIGSAIGLLSNAAVAGSAEQAAKSLTISVIVIAVMSMAVGVVYSLVTMGMGNQNSSFRTAGMYYLISTLISLGYDLTGFNLLKVFAAILGALYIMKFASAMNESLYSVDYTIACSWDKFRTVYFIMIGATVLCTFLALIPIIGLLAIFGLLACAVAAIVLMIWQLILLFNSANAFGSYMPPEPVSRPRPSIVPDIEPDW